MLIENSLSITIACIIMVLIIIIWIIDVTKIIFTDKVDKILKIAINGLEWSFILVLLIWVLKYIQKYIG